MKKGFSGALQGQPPDGCNNSEQDISRLNNGGNSDSSGGMDISGGLFGGMEIVRVRQRKSAGSTAGSHTTCAESSASLPVKETNFPSTTLVENKPFFVSFDMPSTNMQDEVEAPQVTQMRKRLERFCSEYCLAMLPQVENIIKKHIHREEELFRMLVSKYGPEPKQLLTSDLPRGDEHFSRNAGSEVESAFGFIASDGKKKIQSNVEGGSANSPMVPGFSFLHVDRAQSDHGQTLTEAVDISTNKAEKVKCSAFEFVTTDPGTVSTGVNLISPERVVSSALKSYTPTYERLEKLCDNEDDEGVEKDDDDDSDGEEEEEVLPLYRTETTQENQDDNKNGNIIITTTVNKSKNSNDKEHTRNNMRENTKEICDSSDSDAIVEPVTLWERQRCEIQVSEREVLLARGNLSHVIDEIRTSIEQRRDTMEKIKKIEERIDECVTQEAFEEADVLSSELQQLTGYVAELDAAPVRLLTSLSYCRDRLAEAVRNLSQLLQRHRQELLETKDEEEWRVKKFIHHTRSNLEGRNKKTAAALEQARRVESSALQETTDLRERKAKLKGKLLKQCGKLQTLQGQLLREKTEMDEEILALEMRLEGLRKASAKKALELRDVTSNLQRRMAEHESIEGEIDDFIKKEEERLRDAAASIEQLRQESEMLSCEEREFEKRKELMLAELRSSAVKVEDYERRRLVLESETLSAILAYSDVLVAPLQMRVAGRGVLFAAPPSSLDSTEWVEDSPVLHVHKLQRQLQVLDADDERCEACVASVAGQLTDMRNRITLLETAKKSAAQAKRFKEAQLKAEEIRLLTNSIEELTAASSSAQETLRSNMSKRTSLQQELTVARATAAERTREFLARYREVLEAAMMATVPTAAPNVLQLPLEEQGSDELAETMQRLMSTLREELQNVSQLNMEETAVEENELPVNTLKQTKEERLRELLDLQDNAQEVEDYEECERLQDLIDSLNDETIVDEN